MEPVAIAITLGRNERVECSVQEDQDVQPNLCTFAFSAVFQPDTYIVNSCKTEQLLPFYNVSRGCQTSLEDQNQFNPIVEQNSLLGKMLFKVYSKN